MNQSVPSSTPVDHPLVVDRPRLERITDNMSVQIQRVLFRAPAPPDTERTLQGGTSVDDVLQDALLALLSYDPERLKGTWESLSVGIARHKAVDAIRRSTQGRRGRDQAPEDPDEIQVLSLNAMESSDALERRLLGFGLLEGDAEAEFIRAEQQRVILRLAREMLSDRDKAVFFGIHHRGRTKVDLAHEVGLTPQGVGQLYVRIAKQLYERASQDPAFANDEEPRMEGGPHD